MAARMGRVVFLAALMLTPVTAWAQTPAPSDVLLYVISPRDGQRVRSPFTVQFGLRNMGVTRAGDKAPNVGHHHLLVDVDASSLEAKEPVPTDRKHLHFGGGQTETKLDLPPGKHTLQLVLGDAEHKLFNPAVISDKVTITVVTPAQASTRRRRPARAKTGLR